MQQRAKLYSSIASVALAALLCAVLVFVAKTADRIEPSAPTASPADPFEIVQMLVSPSDQTGDADDDSNEQDDQTNDQDTDRQPQQQEPQTTPTQTTVPAASTTPEDSGNPTDPSQNTPGQDGGSGGGDPSSGGDDPAFPQDENELIDTNLPGPGNSNETVFPDDSRVNGSTLEYYVRLGGLADSGDRIASIVVRSRQLPDGNISVQRVTPNASGEYTLEGLRFNHYYEVTVLVQDASGATRTAPLRPDGSRTSNPGIYSFTYSERLADIDSPTIGDNPPTIEALIGGEVMTPGGSYNALGNNTIQIRASSYSGQKISYNSTSSAGLRVYVDGEEWSSYEARQEGHAVYPNAGVYDVFDLTLDGDGEDYRTFTLGVVAQDDEGNSRYVQYSLKYELIPEGAKIGTITVALNAGVLGLGTIDYFETDLIQGKSLADTLREALEDQGLNPVFRGDYFRGITGGGIASGAYIPSDLIEKLQEDGLTIGGIPSESLCEFDVTGGSGWLYRVNGSGFSPSTSLGAYSARDGDYVELVFTLAWGKDLGLSSSAGGTLSSYCGSWESGYYVQAHSFNEYVDMLYDPRYALSDDSIRDLIRRYATDDYCVTSIDAHAYVCSVCGAVSLEPGATQVFNGVDDLYRPEYGAHDWVLTYVMEPDVGEEGEEEYECSRCGRTRLVIIPALPEPEPEPNPEPEGGE